MLEKIKKYIVYLVLLITIFVLFINSSYQSLNRFSKTRYVVNNEVKEIRNNIVYDNSYIYISYEDMEHQIPDNIFKESALKKIIITANNKVKVYSLDSKESYTNYTLDNENNIVKYLSYDGKDYILLDELCSIYGFDKIVDKELNMINVINSEVQIAKLNCYREYGYLTDNNKSKRITLDRKIVLNVVKDDNYYSETADMVCAVVEMDNIKRVVYVPKKSIDMDFEYKTEEIAKKEFKFFVQNEDNLNTNTEYTTIFTGFKLISNDGSVSNVLDANSLGANTYVMITNGYRASNYDSGITSYALQNMASRERIITEVTNKIKDTKVEGIVVNFRDFKVSSKEYFTQFIKELSEYLHGYNKKLIVYIPIDALYIDELSVLKFADNCIFIEYGLKSENSITSGADSPLYLFKEKIDYLNENNANISKVIMETPLYSLLWIEKEQKVIDVQYLYKAALDSFISKNSLVPVLDEKSGQMYVAYEKGSLMYKMWLEDDYSLNQKIKIAKDNMIGGISLYKKGYEKNDLFL